MSRCCGAGIRHIANLDELSVAERNMDRAIAAWDEGFRLIQQMPTNPSNSALKESWLEWLAEINQRQAQSGSL